MDVRGTQFDLAGVLRLGLDDSDPVTQRLVSGELDPYPAAQALAGDRFRRINDAYHRLRSYLER